MSERKKYWVNKKTGRYYWEVKGMPRKLCLNQVNGTSCGILVFDSESDANARGWERTDDIREYTSQADKGEDFNGCQP